MIYNFSISRQKEFIFRKFLGVKNVWKYRYFQNINRSKNVNGLFQLIDVVQTHSHYNNIEAVD